MSFPKVKKPNNLVDKVHLFEGQLHERPVVGIRTDEKIDNPLVGFLRTWVSDYYYFLCCKDVYDTRCRKEKVRKFISSFDSFVTSTVRMLS